MAGPLRFDRVRETTTTTGTGTITLAGAVAGYRSFSVVGNGNSCYYAIAGGSLWEVGVGTWTASGTTLSRQKVLASSNAGALVSLTAGTYDVILTAPASSLSSGVGMWQGRVSTEAGVPISTTDRTAQSTLCFVPYVGNRICLWNGYSWDEGTFPEDDLALSGLTTGKIYDVFAYLDGSDAPAYELSAAWTNNTTRADALGLQDGTVVKNSDKTRLHIGTIRTTGTTTTEDSYGASSTQVGGKRFVWNRYNQAPRGMLVLDTAASWSYTTDTWRIANGATGPLNCVEYVVGAAGESVNATLYCNVYFYNNVRSIKAGIGFDSSTATIGLLQSVVNTSPSIGFYASLNAAHLGISPIGYHYISWLEKGGDGTSYFLGGEAGGQQSGLFVTVYG